MSNKELKALILVATGLLCLVLGVWFLTVETIQTVEMGIMLVVVGGISSTTMSFMYLHSNEKKRLANKGVVYVWVVALIGIVVMSLGWFTLSWAGYAVIENVLEAYDFPAEALQPINLTRNILGWFLVFFSVGLLVWAFLASMRREAVTEPYGVI